MDHDATLAQIVEWATADDNIRLVILTGSGARGGSDVDPLSDLDVELYVSNPEALLDHDDWHGRFGQVLVTEALPNAGWNPTRLLYLVDGKIDFTIVHIDDTHRMVQRRPFRVLLDRDARAEHLAIDAAPPRPPDPAQLSECCNWFYAAALMEAKLLVRGQLWQAKFREWDLLQQLLRMITWDHKARHGWDRDTWYNGKNVEQWADSDVWSSMRGCWSSFDRDDMRRALRAAVELFVVLEPRTAVSLGLPSFDHHPVSVELERLLALSSDQ